MLTLTLGRRISAGYWSGERVTVRRARRDYACACGRPEHTIHKGSLYLAVTPDRLAAWTGGRYTRRLHPTHATEPIRVVDEQGREIAVTGRRRRGLMRWADSEWRGSKRVSVEKPGA